MAWIPTWLTDFRADLPQIDVPILVVQGTEDRILPIDATGRRLPALLKDARLIEVEAGPHNTGWTHPEEVNRALLGFLVKLSRQLRGSRPRRSAGSGGVHGRAGVVDHVVDAARGVREPREHVV